MNENQEKKPFVEPEIVEHDELQDITFDISGGVTTSG